MSSHEEHCLHESWECEGGWHTCTDCRRGLGTLYNTLEPHDIYACDICFGVGESLNSPGKVPMESSGFVTKDSGKRQQFESGMQRDTQEGKARFDLLFPENVPYSAQFFTRVAELLARGAEKYESRNWEQAFGEAELERFKASALRHMAQWVAGDEEEDHASAVVFNLLGYETTKWKLENEGTT